MLWREMEFILYRKYYMDQGIGNVNIFIFFSTMIDYAYTSIFIIIHAKLFVILKYVCNTITSDFIFRDVFLSNF